MNLRHLALFLIICSIVVGCAATSDEGPELTILGEEEVRSRFPTLSVACIPEVRLDSWSWLNHYNLIVWTHAQRRNPYWLQMESNCIAMRQTDNMAFRDGDRDRQICGTGNDAIDAVTGGFRRLCRIATVRPLDPLELNQVLLYFGKPPLPVRPEDLEDESAAEDED